MPGVRPYQFFYILSMIIHFPENLCNDIGWFWGTTKGKTFEKDCSECNQCYSPEVMKMIDDPTNMASINRGACNRAIENGKCAFDDITMLCKNVDSA